MSNSEEKNCCCCKMTKEKKCNGVKICKDFAKSTSCHGISEISSFSEMPGKVIWFLLVLIVFGVLIWQIILRCIAYVQFDTRLQISQNFADELPLPAITICNANRYFSLTPEERRALNTISFIYDNGNGNGTERNGTDEAIKFFRSQGDDFSLTDYLISKSWQFNEDTIKICYVGALEGCIAANFTSSFSTNLGQCWTLNTNVTQQKRGVTQGFHILLNVYQANYTEDPTYGRASAGIIFQVHPHHEPHQVAEVGQSVGVGQWGTVAMHKLQNTNMYEPWGNCVPSNENLDKYDVYTVAACMKQCLDQAVNNNCSCRDPSMSVTRYPNATECTPTDVIECAGPVRSSFEAKINPVDCNCTQACSETKYRTSVSYSTCPSQIAEREIGAGRLSLEDLRDNFLGLTFYFDDLSTTTVVESETISVSALISDVGGQLGFWIGISVVTLCEFIQFFIRLCANKRWKTKKKKKEKSFCCC